MMTIKQIIKKLSKKKEFDEEKERALISLYKRELKKKLYEINQQLFEQDNILQRLNSAIYAKRFHEDIEITDHAIVRYLERVKNLDIEKIKKDILDDLTIEKIKTNEFTIINNSKGYQLSLKGKKVVTVFYGDN